MPPVFILPGDVERMLESVGFGYDRAVQTFFGDIRQMDRPDPIKEGTGSGSFVVIKVKKG